LGLSPWRRVHRAASAPKGLPARCFLPGLGPSRRVGAALSVLHENPRHESNLHDSIRLPRVLTIL
jgi:hypothetical protein